MVLRRVVALLLVLVLVLGSQAQLEHKTLVPAAGAAVPLLSHSQLHDSEVHRPQQLTISAQGLSGATTVTIHIDVHGPARVTPDKVTLTAGTSSLTVEIKAHDAGQVKLDFDVASNNSTYNKYNLTEVSMRFLHSIPLQTVNSVIGWLYFLAWSISFYPQVIENFRRKSVIGLNFDYLALNITGFLGYMFFNVGLYYVDSIKREYFRLHPGATDPVEANDVFFACHAVVLTLITIGQCFIYERGGQRVSHISGALVVGAWIFIVISLGLTLGHVISWLTYLNYFSYIKLGVTLIKYIPQALMNYSRKSTVGWSIGNVLLDFTGGTLSITQMVLQSYNNADWTIFYGNITKLGLGFFSIFFDVIFIVQHYILYRDRRDPAAKRARQHSNGYTVNDEVDPLLSPVS